MADKIEVWAHLHSHRGEWFVDEKPHETKVAGLQKASTLVVHDGLHERVFTESEVRAVIQRMEEQAEANMRTSIQFPGHREVDEIVVHDLIDDACEALGIVLDPA